MAKKKNTSIQSVGKRKTSIARATLVPGKGIIKINNMPVSSFGNSLAQTRISEPILLAGETVKKVDIDIHVSGGGWQGQSDSVRLAIGKVLAKYDKTLRKAFLNYDRQLLVADVRRKEKCKPNKSKARALRQKSYR